MDELRERFNNGGFVERVRRHELRQVLVRNNHPAPEMSGQPYCTRSQIIDYYDQEGHKVAKIHQYLLPDGSLGASGRPDLKWLEEGGVRYRGFVRDDRGSG